MTMKKDEFGPQGDRDATRRMIEYTLREAHKLGDEVCIYFLNSALESLEDGPEGSLGVLNPTRLN